MLRTGGEGRKRRDRSASPAVRRTLCCFSRKWSFPPCGLVQTSREENDISNAKERRHFTGQEKVAILRRHLVEKVPMSDLCEEHGINPTLFYRWQKDLFEQGAAVFDAP